MSLASKTPPISRVSYDERSRQVRWSLDTGFAKSTGNSCNSPRLGIWLLTSTEEPYPPESQKPFLVKYWGQFLVAKYAGPRLSKCGSTTLTSGGLSQRPVRSRLPTIGEQRS